MIGTTYIYPPGCKIILNTEGSNRKMLLDFSKYWFEYNIFEDTTEESIGKIEFDQEFVDNARKEHLEGKSQSPQEIITELNDSNWLEVSSRY